MNFDCGSCHEIRSDRGNHQLGRRTVSVASIAAGATKADDCCSAGRTSPTYYSRDGVVDGWQSRQSTPSTYTAAHQTLNSVLFSAGSACNLGSFACAAVATAVNTSVEVVAATRIHRGPPSTSVAYPAVLHILLAYHHTDFRHLLALGGTIATAYLVYHARDCINCRGYCTIDDSADSGSVEAALDDLGLKSHSEVMNSRLRNHHKSRCHMDANDMQ